MDDLAGGVEIEEFGCQLRGCPGNARLGLLPAASSQPAEVGFKALGADIARQAVCLVDGHEELVAPCIGRFLAGGKGLSGDCAIAPRSGVLKVEVFTVDRIDAARDQSAVDTNAVVLVDDDVARLEIGEGLFRCNGAPAGAAAGFRYVPAEEFLIGEQMANAVGASPLPAAAAHSLDEGERR